MGTKAASTRLAPGETSIDRARVRQTASGSWTLDWRIRLANGRLLNKRTAGDTKTRARENAKRAAELLLSTGERAPWSPTMPAEKFISDESARSVAAAGLAPATVRLYTTALTRVSAELKGLPLIEAAKFGELEGALQAISERYGVGAARNAKKALSGHFIAPLLRHGVIDVNPLQHMIDIASMAKETVDTPRGSAELTNADRERVIGHLLDLDRSRGVEVRSRSRWSYEHRLAVRKNAIDQALLQAATGLRLQEAVGQKWGDIENGWLTTTFPKPVRVGGKSVRKPRTIPILSEQVRSYFEAEIVAAGSPWVLPNPSDPMRPWGVSAAKEMMIQLYTEMASELKIPALHSLRSHAWRTCINRHMISQGVPADVRTAYLGHSEAVNIESYTHGVDLGPVAALAGMSGKSASESA